MNEKTANALGWMLVVLVVYTAFMVTLVSIRVGDDRRDVNRDGVVNITDLSVLAVEISEQNKAE